MVPEKPFAIRDIDPSACWLREKGELLPDVIASFLAQADEVSDTLVQSGCRYWIVRFDPGVQVIKLYDHFTPGIRACGGAIISAIHDPEKSIASEKFRDVLVYPFNWQFGFYLLEKCGFGVDAHVYSQDGLPLEPNLNTPERVNERRRRAIEFITELHAEIPIVLESVYSETAMLSMINPPPGKVARKWADLAWDFHTENYSAARDPVHCSLNSDAFTRVESRRRAKDGRIAIGSW